MIWHVIGVPKVKLALLYLNGHEPIVHYEVVRADLSINGSVPRISPVQDVIIA